jgi:hypothetical protein
MASRTAASTSPAAIAIASDVVIPPPKPGGAADGRGYTMKRKLDFRRG